LLFALSRLTVKFKNKTLFRIWVTGCWNWI